MLAAEGGASEPKTNLDFQPGITEARKSFITFFQENRDVLFERPKDASPERIGAELEKIFDDPQVDPDARPQLLVLSLKPYATGLLTCAINYLNLIEELNQCVTTINDCKNQLHAEDQPVTEKTIIEKLSQTGLAQQNQFVHAFMRTDSSTFAGEVSEIFALKREELNDTILLANQCIKEHKKNPAIKLMAACVGRHSPKFAVVEKFEQEYDKMLNSWSGLPPEPAAENEASVSRGEEGDADLPAGDEIPLLREESISVGSDDSSGDEALHGNKAQQSVLPEESVPGGDEKEEAEEQRVRLEKKYPTPSYLLTLKVDSGFLERRRKADGATISAPFLNCTADMPDDPNAPLLAN